MSAVGPGERGARRVLVAGCGAIGSVFGCLLSAAGHRVTLLGRPAAMREVARRGLTVDGIWGEHRAENLRVATHAAELDGDYDAVLVTCKSYQTSDLVHALGDRIGECGVAISLQNGLGNAEKIAAVVGAERVLAARVIFGAELGGPATVHVTVEAEPVLVGRLGGGEDATARAWAEAFAAAGIASLASDSILAALWGKVFYNAALNPLGALLGLRYGELADEPEYCRVMDRVITEAYDVARAQGVALPWASVEEYLQLFYERLVPSTYAHRSSMLQDIERGKPTEIDAICGEVCRRGERSGVDTVTNRLLALLVRARSATAHASSHEG